MCLDISGTLGENEEVNSCLKNDFGPFRGPKKPHPDLYYPTKEQAGPEYE